MSQTLWQQIEDRHGKPMLELLQEQFKQHKTQSAVARAIGVKQPTLWGWLLQLGVEPESSVQLVPRKHGSGPDRQTVPPGQLSFAEVVPGE